MCVSKCQVEKGSCEVERMVHDVQSRNIATITKIVADLQSQTRTQHLFANAIILMLTLVVSLSHPTISISKWGRVYHTPTIKLSLE